MKRNLLFLFLILFIICTKTFAQPFVDVMNFNYQTFSTNYKDTTRWKNKIDNYFLNLFIPKEFKNGNTLLIRINSEMMNSTFSPDSSYSKQLAAVSIPLGFMFVSKNKKWKTVAMVVPKIASDFRDNAMTDYNYQLGGIFIENFQIKENVKLKLGLYYNSEAFGNFFMPLVGVDWKINKRINLYGILPSNYKLEFNIIKNRLYTGLCFKSATRSYRLSKGNNYDYVRYDEEEIKLFIDCFVAKKILVFAEAGYTLGKSPIQYMYNTKDIAYYNPIYSPTKPYMLFNFGMAYRIRTDFEKKEEK